MCMRGATATKHYVSLDLLTYQGMISLSTMRRHHRTQCLTVANAHHKSRSRLDYPVFDHSPLFQRRPSLPVLKKLKPRESIAYCCHDSFEGMGNKRTKS